MSDRDATTLEETSSFEDEATIAERRSSIAPRIDGGSGGSESGESLDTNAATHARARLTSSARTPPFAVNTVDLSARTLVRDEILRSRSLGGIGLTLSLVVAVVVPFLGASAAKTALMVGVCVVAALANVGLLVLCRDVDRFRPKPLAAIWISTAIAVSAGVSFFGVFSAAPLAAGLGVYFVSLGTSRWLAYAVWLIIAAILAAVALATMLGVAADPGLITADHLSVTHRLLLLILLQGLLLAVFVLGRHSRRGTASAVAELERTTRALAQRDALLDEARADLNAVIGGGGAGPWSGRRLADYLIGQLLGRGGMGEVYEAIGADDQRVAIKLLTPASSLDGKIVERFRREAEITAALRSPHIVRVHAISESGAHVPYLVMERLSGKDLAEVLRKHVILEETSLVALVQQIASGLAVAHAAGVVHRDIKPHNLFADERSGKRVWKILDFGVSKLGEHSGTLTQGHVVGTPAYMAPEQAIGDASVGPAADTYALAAISYRCLTGRPPFRGKSAAALLFNVVHEMPVRPSSLVRVSASVDSVLALGMAKDPIARVQSAAAFAEAFVAALRGELDGGLESRAREIELATPWRET